MAHHHRVVRRQCFELVRRRLECEAGNLCDLCRHQLVEALGRVEAGADGGAALCQFHQRGQRRLDARNAILDLLRIAGEFLAERQRGRILRVRAADLDDLLPVDRLLLQRCVQVLEGREQVGRDLLGAGDVHRGRERIVRRLAHVHVVVRVNRLLRAHHAAHHFDGAVRDHLVGVHVRLRARTRLPHDQREMIVQLAVDHFLRRCDDVLGQLRLQLAQLKVCFRRRTLHDAQRPHDRGRLFFPTDLEVAERALRLRAPIPVCRHFDRAKGIGFGAVFSGHWYSSQPWQSVENLRCH